MNVLIPGDDGWRLAWPGSGGAFDVDASADAAVEALETADRPRAVVVALPSTWCMAASVETAGLPRRGRRRALLYRLEDRLPTAAEDVAAGFVVGETHAFGVAVDARRLGDLVTDLEAAGLTVAHAAPAALLATQARPSPAADVVLWDDYDAVEAVVVRDGIPAAWLTAGGGLAAQVRMATLDLDRPPAVATHGVSPDLLGDLDVVEADGLDFVTAVAEGASRPRPWADVLPGLPGRMDPATRRLRRPVVASLLAAALLLAAVTAGALWRASQYRGVVEDAETRQAAAFRAAFPGERLPPIATVPRRLRIAASNQTPADADPTSALDTLGRVLDALPDDRRFRVDRLRIGPRELRLEGEARSLADAGAVAEALRDLDAYAVEPPGTTQREPGRVEFRVVGTREEER